MEKMVMKSVFVLLFLLGFASWAQAQEQPMSRQEDTLRSQLGSDEGLQAELSTCSKRYAKVGPLVDCISEIFQADSAVAREVLLYLLSESGKKDSRLTDEDVKVITDLVRNPDQVEKLKRLLEQEEKILELLKGVPGRKEGEAVMPWAEARERLEDTDDLPRFHLGFGTSAVAVQSGFHWCFEGVPLNFEWDQAKFQVMVAPGICVGFVDKGNSQSVVSVPAASVRWNAGVSLSEGFYLTGGSYHLFDFDEGWRIQKDPSWVMHGVALGIRYSPPDSFFAAELVGTPGFCADREVRSLYFCGGGLFGISFRTGSEDEEK